MHVDVKNSNTFIAHTHRAEAVLHEFVSTWNEVNLMKSISWVFRSSVQLACNIHTVFIPIRKVHGTTAFFVSAWGSKKKHRKVKLQFTFDRMSDPRIEEILAPLRAFVKEQVSFDSISVCVGFLVSIVVTKTSTVYGCVPVPIKIHLRFGVSFCLYLQVQIVIQAGRQTMLLVDVRFILANRGCVCLRNVCELISDYMASHPKRH